MKMEITTISLIYFFTQQLAPIIDAVERADSFAKAQDLAVWEDKLETCEHALCLIQDDLAPQLAAKSLAQCQSCDKVQQTTNYCRFDCFQISVYLVFTKCSLTHREYPTASGRCLVVVHDVRSTGLFARQFRWIGWQRPRRGPSPSDGSSFGVQDGDHHPRGRS
jgi:hypothetical protein